MTRKLYYEDAYCKTFTAQIVEQGTEANGTPYVVLDQTAFYPTGGGQPCDLGVIHGVNVTDVEEIGDRVVHRLEQALPAGLTEVEGHIDWQRRFDHMQQHTGQHMLSAVFEDLFEAETLSFHLGRERVTIDIARPELEDDVILQVEAAVNQAVFDNRPVSARFVGADELAQMPLRKPPSVTENIRVVIVEGLDYSPCGGTHPARTGEVGPIKILGWERYKGNVRLEFVCGHRTLQAMSEKQAVLRNLTRQLTCSEKELPDNLERVLNERRDLDKTLQAAREKLIAVEAQELLGAAPDKLGVKVIASEFQDRSIPELQKLGQQITALDPSSVALLITSGAKTQLVFVRGGDVTVPMNELIKETLPLIAGKGGGTPAMAQGGGNADVAVSDVLAHARHLFEAKLGQPA